jgi:hypothetical protein
MAEALIDARMTSLVDEYHGECELCDTPDNLLKAQSQSLVEVAVAVVVVVENFDCW